MRKLRILTYVFLVVLFFAPFIGASNRYITDKTAVYLYDIDSLRLNRGDSLSVPFDSLQQLDSLILRGDSLFLDSVPQKKPVLEAIVDYKAKDSIVLTGDNMAYLYGEGDITYNTESPIKLKSEKIRMSLDSSIVTATFGLDSVGKEFGYPIFNDGSTDYESKSMRYNFKTKKGYSKTTITEQGEGYVVAGVSKMNPDKTAYATDVKYTTCDHHDHPHFYLNLTKAKIEPGKRIITGPAYLVIEDLPLPLAIPFGFFPFSKRYSSGVIMPSYGDELEKGFALRDGGYYFAINDYIDLKLTGEIYTKGSWGVNAQSAYRKRYKYSGNVNLGYQVTKLGDKGLPDYSVMKDMKVSWTHTQDPKYNMYRTLSASVNFSTSSYDRNNTTSQYMQDYTQSSRSSSVNMTQRIPNSPWTINLSANVNQTTRDSMIAMTLPNMTITMSRIYPFKRKEAVGDERWYEKISMSYTGDLRNSINTKENKLFKSDLMKDWKNGMQHRIPIQATFSAFNYLNITPSVNYNERWYTTKIRKDWVDGAHRVVDTINGFNRVYDFNFSLGFSTKLYGFYTPLIGGDKVKAIRHVFTPTISFSLMPDFGRSPFNFHETYSYYDNNGMKQEYTYSPYEQGIFGAPPKGKSGSINFNFQNNLEMKVKSDNDSIGEKKISLIDDLSVGFSYNMMADSMKWSDITTNMRLKLSKSLTVNLNATWDPYMYDRVNTDPNKDPQYDRLNRVDRLRISNGKGFGRLMRTAFSISPSINQDTVKKWFGKGGDDTDNKKNNDDGSPLNEEEDTSEEAGPRGSMFERKQDDGEYDSDGYLKNEIQWNLSFNYSVNYAYSQELEKRKNEYKRKLTHNFSINGSFQPTKNWNFTFNTSYDFDQNKFAYLNCSLTRNLHCWSISASFIPIGPYKSYFISLRATSSMLQDLKYDKRGRSSSYDPNWGD